MGDEPRQGVTGELQGSACSFLFLFCEVKALQFCDSTIWV